MPSDRAILDQVRQANDIVDVVGAYVALRPAGGTYKGICPFHSDSRPSFDVDPRRQRYKCWSCGAFGDVFKFIMEFEKVTFPEALAMLARRAGIELKASGPDPQRLRLTDAMKWAAGLYHECFLEGEDAQAARRYVGSRGLTGETVRRWQLGFAPLSGQWLVQQAVKAGIDLNTLVEIGLLGRREQEVGCYDRFRDRVMFPIRSATGQTVGFGGRILPESPYASRSPKYYNSAETPLFSKSELLYGLDQAKHAAAKEGYLAVVEGYTDVLMAHQHGVPQVVATMGTALNARHVQQLKRYVKRVVLVFDADAGGITGVDRALEIFAGQNFELAIATLPAGMDPCDLLTAQGREPFVSALTGAVDALDFKLNQVLAKEQGRGVEGQRRMIDAVLGIIALTPDAANQDARIKQQLIITHVAHRLGLKEESLWARLGELRSALRKRAAETAPPAEERNEPRAAKAAPEEQQLLEVLLAEPALVPLAAEAVKPDRIAHLGLRRMLQGLYDLHAAGDPPDLDGLRVKLEDGRLIDAALRLQDVGRTHPDRAESLKKIIRVFRDRAIAGRLQELLARLAAATTDAERVEILRELQRLRGGPDAPA